MPRSGRLCFALLVLASPGSAAAPAASSVYTPLDLDRCRVIARVEEGESISWLCPGLAGIPLLISSGDGRFDLDAGIDNGEWESLPQFNRPGPRVEWRRRGGRPFAVIYRLVTAGADQRPGSVLGVETIGRQARPGCLIALIGGALPNANALARDIADRRAPTFRCGRDSVTRHGIG